MSYPGGFFRFRIGDRGTQGMARGEDNVGSRVDEGPSSTSSGDFPSRVDAIGVIMVLRPVGESRVSLEEIFLSSQCPGFFFFLEISFCRLYRRGSRWNEFHLLAGDSY